MLLRKSSNITALRVGISTTNHLGPEVYDVKVVM